MPQSEQINELATALATAQAEMDFAKKDSANPFFKSSYADLAAVWEVCRNVLPKNGLAVAQTLEEGDGVRVRTTLMHKSGQWIAGTCALPPVKQDPQAYGSAITYARRYSLAAIVGVIADDDDGEAAMGRDRQAEQAQKPKSQPKPAPKPATPSPATPPAYATAANARTLPELEGIWKANTALQKDVEFIRIVNSSKARLAA